MAPSTVAPAANETRESERESESDAEQEATLQVAAAHDHITQLNATNSPLLRLPAELRNQIYEYALGGHIFYFYTECSNEYPHDRFFHNDIALVYVCRQLNAETALLPYALNSFIYRYYGRDSAENFVHQRSLEQLRVMKSIRLLNSELGLQVSGNGMCIAEHFNHPDLYQPQEVSKSN
ncbi:hypothetical protein CFE70_001059 [Pyrenophora teres f. teres 0-1]|uniref:Uncharacterized protein n=2 Tax=Pyrenophora teres f. teres TaxID=97479 RepID=E3RLK9_PYRTT|nr:hypothetical protein PTT_09262 [Pyrenophora teres f. teres 0-1]KAE8822827.1 hypothetical protein HRS9139_10167 [Pyrenophora teres f. teres]KAE8826045.1 hypothetical protein PTNB85_08990 [Pyrenophora teres f. teres]KAE8832946.1 hypothetical protein HRS9122_08659 [Pyrenophora teres f. teres]KAE8852896.1 hypothetical protein PTNB29_10286 [Pyrenophora teres f. teres]